MRVAWRGSAIGWTAALLVLVGCGAGSSENGIDSELLEGADDTADSASALSGNFAVGTTLATTADLHLRNGPSSSATSLRVIPDGSQVVTVNRTAPSNGWYNVRFAGTEGWSHGSYLRYVAGPSSPSGGSSSSATGGANRDGAIARAKSGVGFSYWWGHGRWQASGPTSSTRGSCTGTCPSCSHGGSSGADCSGYVAKAWQVPSSNTSLSTDSHPYNTWNFFNQSTAWHTVARGSMQKGDALVHNTGDSGHIFLYESGDSWGSLWAYEARGCSAGIIRSLRTATSVYRAIARDGY